MADTLIYPVAQQLLECFCDALAVEYPEPDVGRPANCCIRVGESVSADADLYTDLCCEGLAWVRPVEIFAAAADFPAPDTSAVVTGCGMPAWGLVLELGVLRCAPTGDITEIPTCEDWTALAEYVMRDAKAMRAAICCLIPQFDASSVAIGQWQPLPTTGGCAGGSMNITVQIINDCEDC